MRIHNASEDYYPNNEMHGVNNILEDNGCETRNEATGAGAFSNFFLTPDSVTNGYIIFDMGCEVLLTSIDLRNTHGGRFNE